MREIKFRVWNGEAMVSPDCIDRNGIAHWNENSIPESTDKVMLWTGLLDKQGKEIYEGDIVKVHSDGRYKHELHQFTVEWDNNVSAFDSLSLMLCRRRMEERLGDPTTELEVIGNIYENPELLMEGK